VVPRIDVAERHPITEPPALRLRRDAVAAGAGARRDRDHPPSGLVGIRLDAHTPGGLDRFVGAQVTDRPKDTAPVVMVSLLRLGS
jgi:hypothetical protein